MLDSPPARFKGGRPLRGSLPKPDRDGAIQKSLDVAGRSLEDRIVTESERRGACRDCHRLIGGRQKRIGELSSFDIPLPFFTVNLRPYCHFNRRGKSLDAGLPARDDGGAAGTRNSLVGRDLAHPFPPRQAMGPSSQRVR